MTLDVLRNAGAVIFLEEHAPGAMSGSISRRTSKKPQGQQAATSHAVIRGSASKKQSAPPPLPPPPLSKPRVEVTAHGEYVHYGPTTSFLEQYESQKRAVSSTSTQRQPTVLLSWLQPTTNEEHNGRPRSNGKENIEAGDTASAEIQKKNLNCSEKNTPYGGTTQGHRSQSAACIAAKGAKKQLHGNPAAQ